MKKILITSILVFLLSGCSLTENGLVFGTPDYEKRNIQVTEIDLSILLKVNELLKNKSLWNNSSIRECRKSIKLSLFCALKNASVEITGNYVHRQPALQEVRFIIDDNYKSRWSVHRLADFNAHPDTSFEDVKSVITLAIEAVKGKLRR
ncbi:MAG: hypothetical protein QNL62_07505 [Gammaproteobacteria bacterium]|nr:hypothetical protein [Gammaproteobacteria bacterium]